MFLTECTSLAHYHSYLEVAFGVNGIVAGWWYRIEPLLLKSKDEIQKSMEKDRRYMNDALTDELEEVATTIRRRLDDDTKVTRAWNHAVENAKNKLEKKLADTLKKGG